jgi:hypothetical protein
MTAMVGKVSVRMRLRTEFAAAFLTGTLLLLSSAFTHGQDPQPVAKTQLKSIPRSEYVGDEVCTRCHQDKLASYNKTSHHLTSQVANKETILGTFQPDTNTMQTANPNLTFRMDSKGDDFFQTAIWATPPNDRTHTQRIDLVIGSGRKGQTYLFWDDNQLFQLPVSYSTVQKQWIYSPGYKDGTADFSRGIVPRCLECHAMYFEAQVPDPQSNFYDRNNFVLGISCERCHGPGRAHVQSGVKQSGASNGSQPTPEIAIVNPAKLSRKLQVDICALCHAGPGERDILPAFSFVPGRPLENYIDLGPNDPKQEVDVHGKQVKLLVKSRCFLASSDMTCSTCHDVHKREPDPARLSQRCLNCHKPEAAGEHAKVDGYTANNCIDCHMPMLESKVVELDVNGKNMRPRFRTHWIRIYSVGERQ